MSDTEATPGKPLPWTDEAKVQFLLRIIAQFREDGKSINWARIRMEGRTTKSLQNMWTKINKEISELEASEMGEGGVTTPSKPRMATPRKPRAKKVDKSEAIVAPGASDDEAHETKKTPKKRAPARSAGTSAAKKIKRDSDEDGTMKEEPMECQGLDEM